MPEQNQYDLLILGSGIAGLSTAFAAIKAGIKTAVADIKKPGSGASGVPQALLNPAPGRRAKKTWNAEVCLNYTHAILEEVQKETDVLFYSENGVVRPALSENQAEEMLQSYKKANWPDSWAEWLRESEMRERFPGLSCTEGGLWVPAGCTVSLDSFINAFYLYLKQHGVSFFVDQDVEVSGSNPWRISGQTFSISFDRIVHATGDAMTRNPHWSMLPLHRVKGQTLILALNEQLPFRCSVSSLGYIAQQGDPSGAVVLGSTYEHQFEDAYPDKKGAAYLLERLSQTIPDIKKRIKKSEGWAGIRVTTPDKKPFAGEHPEIDNLFAIGGLGSKGLMLGPYLGKLLVELITKKNEIPEALSIKRMLT